MTSTLEISLYPLQDNYPDAVLNFLEQLKSIPDVEIQTNGMSSIIIGEFSFLWKRMGDLMAMEMASGSSIFVFKVAPGRREYLE